MAASMIFEHARRTRCAPVLDGIDGGHRQPERKCTPVSNALGSGQQAQPASVTTPSVPSEPTKRSTQSMPGRSR